MSVILLGPQRRPTLDAVLRSLGPPPGTFATVTAGWQEREPDDQELAALLGGRSVNLGLCRRWLDVQGAMALTDRMVLFGDRSAHGPGHAEVYGSGLSVVRGAVLLPHARARLLLDDAPRMAVFARRFAPARCVLLEAGTRIDVDGRWPPGTRVLAEDGHVTSLGAA